MAAEAPVFRSQQIDLPSGRLQYHVAGEGRPVLYLCGSAASVSPALERLAGSFRCYLPALPPDADPAGRAELVEAFADDVAGERCDVIGHAGHAATAAWLAILHPDR